MKKAIVEIMWALKKTNIMNRKKYRIHYPFAFIKNIGSHFGYVRRII